MSRGPAPLDSPWLSTQWMARALGSLFFTGGSLALAWTVLPHGSAGGDLAVTAMAVLAVTMGLVLVSRLGRFVRVGMLHVLIVLIQVVISVAFVASSAPDNDMRLFYAWATPYAAFFFGRRAAFAHGAWTAFCMALSLALIAGSAGVAVRIWLMTAGTVAAVGLLVGVVAGRVRGSHHQLDHAAHHDPLTGLPNRRLFESATREAVERRDREGGTVHVLVVDLDHFKLVNDTLGHQAGDELLMAIAPRLRELVRAEDVVARMGGDEFAIVCDDPHDTFDLSAFLVRLGRVWAAPVPLGHVTVTTSGSVGVASASAPGSSAQSLLRDADVALYRAKSLQRGTASVFDAPMRTQVERRMRIDLGLRNAIERNELRLVYQPVCDLATRRPLAAEALLRWDSADLGGVSPAELVPVAEETGLIEPIGDWVLDRVISQTSAWRALGVVPADFTVSVNVSVRQLRPGFPERVSSLLRQHSLPPSALALEITESVLLGDSARSLGVLTELHSSGVGLHLDDFGTGYSSLSYLQRLPLSCLKIDRSFVSDLLASTTRSALVGAVLTLGASLSMDVVAEGVETEEQARALLALGCTRAQGYLFARPLTPLELASWMEPGSAAGVDAQTVARRGSTA